MKAVLPSKHRGRAARIVGETHAATSRALAAIWDMRVQKLKSADPTSTPKSKWQTMDEKAQRLAAVDKLPGTGGTGTMSFDEYLSLPIRKAHAQTPDSKATNTS